MSDAKPQPTLEDRLRTIFDARGLGGTLVTALIQDITTQVPSLGDSDELRRLVALLHKAQRHPDYEYDSTETGRKTGESKKPEGHGWVPNNDMFDGTNWERDDHTETEYWMRLKTDALKDELDPFRDIKPVVIQPVPLSWYLARLRAFFVKGYMPTSTRTEDGFHSKPQYTSARDIGILMFGTGTYALDGIDRDYTGPQPEPMRFQENEIWFGLDADQVAKDLEYIDGNGLEILTNLTSPDNTTYVRMRKKDGEMGKWRNWFEFDHCRLALHPQIVDKALERYA